MAESSNENVEGRAIVIQRANELDECVRVLEELGVPIQFARGALPPAEQVAGASVVVIPGSRLAETGAPNLSHWPRTIAVVDDASKTMLAHLNRLGVALTVRRPIHPRTLRLLLLHEIYRGPERRRKKRILIGHPIKVAAGLFTRRATLLELSAGGARIELPHTPKVGSKIKLCIGKDLTHTKPVKLQAKVVRCIRPSGEKGRSEAEVGVALLDPKREAKAIHSILERFAHGPASWAGKVEAPSATSPQAETTGKSAQPAAAGPAGAAEKPQPRSTASLPPSRPVDSMPAQDTPPETETAARSTAEAAREATATAAAMATQEPDTTDSSADDEGPVAERRVFAMPAPDEDELACSEDDEHDVDAGEDDADERRRDPRIPYEHRVVALGEEAARVVVGRDLSQGGMRIEASDAVDLGDTLRVALHCGTEMEPLVVLATAERDDGDDGTVLGFHDLTATQKDHLEKIIANSSPIQNPSSIEDPNALTGSIVLGEMLETIRKGPSRPPDSIETEEQIEAHLDSIFDTD